MNRYVCNNCGKEFIQTDFSDKIWKLFCSLSCCFAWCRAHMPKPIRAGESRIANSGPGSGAADSKGAPGPPPAPPPDRDIMKPWG